MPPPPADKRRIPPPDEATLPPSVPGSRPASASAGNDATVPVVSNVPPQLLNHPRYRVLKLLGQGGMGAVYLAEHLVMGRRVALKTINTQFLANGDAVSRFHREVRAAAKLQHPNVVAAYDAEQAGGLHFLVMEYVDGVSVAEYARRKRPLPVDQACVLVSQAALGLQHAHEQGLIHRDVKPANLMLTRKGQVKVLDFGLAQFARQEDARADAAQTASGAVLGTADYIAPEQTSSSRKVDIRADVYSLGCTLYYLLAGQVPFPDGTIIDKFIHHATDTPPELASLRPELPPELVEVVEKMMAKRPEDRYQTPGEVCLALRPFASPGRAPAAPSESKTQLLSEKKAVKRPDTMHRKRIVVAASLLGAGLLVVLVVLALMFSGNGSPGSPGSPGATARPAPAAVTPTLRATAPSSLPARAVMWTGKGPTHPFLAPEHNIRNGILDFRDIAGATPKEFRDWQTGLGPDFRVSFLSNRAGLGPPLFNGVAVRDRIPIPSRVFIGLTDDEAKKVGDQLKAEGLDLDYRVHCAYAEAGQYRHSELWAPGTGGGYFWFGSFDFAKGKVSEERASHKRPYALDWAAVGDGQMYSAFGVDDPSDAWKAFFNLTADKLLATVEEYRAKGWRPDVVTPYWDGERYRFMLVVLDNPEPVDWRLQIDMSLQEYKKVSAEEKEKGLYPLSLTSYGDEAAVKYAALWVRYRFPE